MTYSRPGRVPFWHLSTCWVAAVPRDRGPEARCHVSDRGRGNAAGQLLRKCLPAGQARCQAAGAASHIRHGARGERGSMPDSQCACTSMHTCRPGSAACRPHLAQHRCRLPCPHTPQVPIPPLCVLRRRTRVRRTEAREADAAIRFLNSAPCLAAAALRAAPQADTPTRPSPHPTTTHINATTHIHTQTDPR